MQQGLSDLVLPSIHVLRKRAYNAIGSAKDTPLTVRELFTLGQIVRSACPNPYDELVDDLPGTIESPRTGQTYTLGHIIENELDFQYNGGPRLRRMPVLFGWMAPYGLVSQWPDAIIRVARYLLGDTIEQEERQVDWERARRMHPDV